MPTSKRYLRKKYDLIPGTLVKCASGRYIAYYEHRTDIIANGENETDAKKNLKEMYMVVIEHEESESGGIPTLNLPPHTETKKFTEKFTHQ